MSGRTTTSTERRPRGRRNVGTRLSEEQKQQIIAAVEAGTMDYVAAEAAGISARSFRELRQRAEGRHPTRPSTPELRGFFEAVDAARARARARREIEIAKVDPKHWLRYQARSRPGYDGWTDPIPEQAADAAPVHVPTREELDQVVATLVTSRVVSLPACGDAACACAFHRPVGGEAT